MSLLSIILSLAMAATASSSLYASGQQTASTIKIEATDSDSTVLEKLSRLVPTPGQLEAQKNEFIAFIHFGPNTFTRMEWGNGMEDPSIFALEHIDTDSWCEATKAAGMKMIILTVKHHDGFVLWQSRYTDHGIMSCPFQDGKGDILKELSESCRKYGLKLGLYLSPADLYQIESPNGLYGNLSKATKRTIPRPIEGRTFKDKRTFEFEVDDYNEYFLNQLFEILTEYGPIHEVWFDGAHPKRKGGQTYNYSAWRELIRTLAPEATIFGREDIRWCGNEGGFTRDSEWNTIPYIDNPETMNEFTDLYGELGTRQIILAHEKPFYLRYQPAETNTSIREGWFYRDDTYQNVRSADDIYDVYERSVGGNSIFLLNIPPNRDGAFSPRDTEVLHEVGRRIKATYGTDLMAGSDRLPSLSDQDLNTYVSVPNGSSVTVNLSGPVTVNRVLIQEATPTHGERVEEFHIDAYIDNEWKEVARSTNIGYKRIVRFPEITASKLRISIDQSRNTPSIATLSAHYYPASAPLLTALRSKEGLVSIIAKPSDFNWINHQDRSRDHLNAGYRAYYTIDGTEPDSTSRPFTEPFTAENTIVKAVAYFNGEKGEPSAIRFGLSKRDWMISNSSSEASWDRTADRAIDDDSHSFWQTTETDSDPSISIDLGDTRQFNAIGYTPQRRNGEGLIEEGMVLTSDDGKVWEEKTRFRLGNLINDPTQRLYQLDGAITTRYIKIVPIVIAGDGKGVSMAELDLYMLE